MNLEALLAPIPGTQPCGEDLSFSLEFDQIAEMRREDDPTLDQGEWVTTLKVADWPGVARLCSELLTHKSKDLRLAMWLTESLALTQGYTGLHQGLQVCTALCEQYWDTVYPQADDGDMDERVGNLSWLLQRLVQLADTRPVVRSRQGAGYSLQAWRTAKLQSTQQTGHASDQGDDDKVTVDQIKRAINDTSADALRQASDALRAAHDQLLAFQVVIDGHLGDNGPGFVAAKEALGQALHDMERLMREAGLSDAADLDPSPDAADNATTEDASEHTSGATTRGGPIKTRAQALQQLREVAAFFRRTEPHSPVAYLADKAVKWGDMPLHEWLRQVIKDQGSMAHLQELLGIEDAPGDSQPY